jgi:mannose-6-phosphate isomerase-like protein (cupin superfamily)
MPIQSKTEPARVSASEWQNPGQALRGLLEGKGLQTNITLLRYVTDVVGEGPTLHVHPYDEIFMITEGRARFTATGLSMLKQVMSFWVPRTFRTAIRTWGLDDLIH